MMTAGLVIPVAPKQTALANYLTESCFKTPSVQSGWLQGEGFRKEEGEEP